LPEGIGTLARLLDVAYALVGEIREHNIRGHGGPSDFSPPTPIFTHDASTVLPRQTAGAPRPRARDRVRPISPGPRRALAGLLLHAGATAPPGSEAARGYRQRGACVGVVLRARACVQSQGRGWALRPWTGLEPLSLAHQHPTSQPPRLRQPVPQHCVLGA